MKNEATLRDIPEVQRYVEFLEGLRERLRMDIGTDRIVHVGPVKVSEMPKDIQAIAYVGFRVFFTEDDADDVYFVNVSKMVR